MMYSVLDLRARFVGLLERHVSKLVIRGDRATGLCPFHPDRHPSFSANLEKCVWYCFPCSRGGGAKDFTTLVGEAWVVPTGNRFLKERARYTALARRRLAEEQARAILQRRQEERLEVLWTAYCGANTKAVAAAELLSLFHRRPNLASEFPDLVARTEQEYGEAVFRRVVVEAQLEGEVGG